MRRAVAIMLLAILTASIVLPYQVSSSSLSAGTGGSVADVNPPSSQPSLSLVPFPDPIDTSQTVPEYPLVSRALMLEGGSTDALHEDFDGDGIKDLAVAVSEANMLCVFFGQPDGTFLSWPSRNVSLTGTPIALGIVDRYENGNLEIVVLQRKTASDDFDHFVRVNTTSWISTTPLTVREGAQDFVVGNFSDTSSPDIAVVSEGSDPLAHDGSLEVFLGPSYVDSYQIGAGLGSSSIACGDFDSDGSVDVAVSNRYDLTVEVFLSPLTLSMSPSLTLTVGASPYWLASGNLNGDSRADLVVACQEPSSLRFFYQGDTGLPHTTPSPVVSISSPPSRVVPGDVDSDGKTDLVISSEDACKVLGFLQGISPTWPSSPSFSFPSGAVPRGAVTGDFTGDGITDIMVASARTDWSGSSIAVYPGGDGFSNSNMTVWTSQYYEASTIASGDLDGDGSDDLVLAYPSQFAFGYMLGFSGGTNVVGLEFSPDDLLVADINGDGLSDVITSNRTHAYARVHFGTEDLPSGSWEQIQVGCMGNISDIVTGDLNGDGLEDLAVATVNGTIEVFFNTGSVPAFSERLLVNVTVGQPVLSIAVGDFDSDGLDDLAYPRSERHIDVLIQKTSGDPISLPADITLAATDGPLGQIWAGEVTGDYREDIVAMKSSGDRLYLFDQLRFGEGVDSDSVDLPEVPRHISVVDVTDDERSDLLVMFPSADLLFLYKQSGTSLPATPSMTFVAGAYPVCAGFGDATGDGVDDLLSLDSMSNSVSVWRPIILDVGPDADFSLTVPSPEEGVPFSFIDESIGYDAIVAWLWTLTSPNGTNQTWDLDAEAMSHVVFVLGDGEYTMDLEVCERDGDADSHTLEFTVLEMPPSVVLSLSPSGGRYLEFETITFTVQAESYDPVILYEWQFDASDDGFVADIETEDPETSYSYGSVGDYTTKVRVTDSNGSVTIQSVQLEILDAELSGTFEADVVVTRDPNATHIITFDASALALLYPEISSTTWEFGDGSELTVTGPPFEPVTHTYTPVRDYYVNLSISDDDGNQVTLTRTMHMVEPTISLIGPANGSVVISGTLISLFIGDDSLPLVSVRYSVNGGEFTDFDTLYSISTDGWEDGSYVVEVMAEDKDGNIARKTVLTVTIDDTEPELTILWEGSTVFGGDKMNISVRVDDASAALGAVVLYITFPGDDSPSQLIMHAAGDGVYYTLVEVPKRKGVMEFYVYSQDLAGNEATSVTLSILVELHFMDEALPYLLVIAVVAAMGTALYFMREVSIAVDETFVIYGDGRMLAHSTRRLKPGMDDQVLSSMFVAVQDFIKDSFKDETSFRLRKLDFGDKSVLVEKGEHLFLAVVLHGKASRKVARRMKSVLDDIEDAYSEHLTDWDGDLDKVRGVNDRVKRLYSKAPVLPGAIMRRES